MAELSAQDKAKDAAARAAVGLVEDGMRVGLGTGSTAVFMVRHLGETVRRDALRLTCVATSTATATLAREVGLPVRTLDEVGRLDLTIDGADECDPRGDLIKGGGGALLQEKIVATASDRMVVIADRGKLVDTLGAFALPVEVIGFGLNSTRALIAELLDAADVGGRDIALRGGPDAPFRTDEGNLILDLDLRRIGDPAALSVALNQVPGVVENGLFLDICDTLVLGETDGTAEIRELGDGRARSVQAAQGETENLFAEDAP